jgi:hypothetical protein
VTAEFSVVLDACVVSTIQGPSTFLNGLYQLDRNAVREILEEQAAAINKPVNYVLDRLRINAPRFVDMLRSR